eukprot:5313314-Prymnesium_polylepis.2
MGALPPTHLQLGSAVAPLIVVASVSRWPPIHTPSAHPPSRPPSSLVSSADETEARLPLRRRQASRASGQLAGPGKATKRGLSTMS